MRVESLREVDTNGSLVPTRSALDGPSLVRIPSAAAPGDGSPFTQWLPRARLVGPRRAFVWGKSLPPIPNRRKSPFEAERRLKWRSRHLTLTLSPSEAERG